MCAFYEEYLIKETDREGIIRIYSEKGLAVVANLFATASEVASMFGVSRSTAYRIMKRMARYEVEDLRNPEELHTYNVVKRSHLAAFHRATRGNPHFADPKYQRSLAKRPRKKKG